MEDKMHGLAADISEIKLLLRNLPAAAGADLSVQSNVEELAAEAGKVLPCPSVCASVCWRSK